MFNPFKKKAPKEIVYTDKNLYILTEVQKPGLVNYMQANNMNIKSLSTDVNRLLLGLLREKDPIRLVVIDYGMGGFKSIDAIDNIIGLLSTASQKDLDEDSTGNCTVFTKSGALVNAIKDSKLKVDIQEYKGASDIVRALLKYPERYITPGAQEVEGAPSSDLMSYKYEKDDNKVVEGLKSSKPTVDILDINPMADGESIEGFNCKF